MDTERSDFYAILGVSPTATPRTIIRAYRAQIRMVHPDHAIRDHETDRLRRTEASATLNVAYAVLRDPTKRTDYDLRRAHEIVGPSGIVVHSDGASAGTSARAAPSAPPRDDPFPAVDPSFHPTPSAADPFSATLWNWLRLTHEGEWVALILAAIAIWLFGLAIGLPSPLGPDLTLLAVVLLLQPALAGRWRETPAADLFCAVGRAIRRVAACAIYPRVRPTARPAP
jgi:hypothetical protein